MCVWGDGGRCNGDINLTISLSFSLIELVTMMIKSLLGVLESKAKRGTGSL